MKTTKQQWLSQYEDSVRARDLELLELAYDILAHNTLNDKNLPWGACPVITPWNNPNAGIWNWDSAFHAMAAGRFDTELAKSCIEAFLQFQKPDGMLPDVIRVNGDHVDTLSKPL